MTLGKMSAAEFGDSVRREGQRVFESDGIWWREVRPFFARPLLPYEPLAVSARNLPWRYRLGGSQWALTPGLPANSTLQMVMFRDAAGYRLEHLPHKRRWEVRAAARRFAIRTLDRPDLIKGPGHDVYAEFFARTGYGYRAGRVRKREFDAWVDTLFESRNVHVLGAFAGDALAAVAVFRVVDDTLVYSSFFARSDALKHHAASLMVHRLRELTAADGSVRQIFVGMRKSGPARTIDDFYLHRGGVICTVPAHLQLAPGVGWLLRTLRPELYRHMLGEPEPAALAAPVP